MKFKNFLCFFLLLHFHKNCTADSLSDLESFLKNLTQQLNSLFQELQKFQIKTPTPTVQIPSGFENFYQLAQNYQKDPKKYNNEFLNQNTQKKFFNFITDPKLKNLKSENVNFLLSNIPDWFAEEFAFKLIKKKKAEFTDIIETFNVGEISSIALSPDKTKILCGTYLDKQANLATVFLFDLTTKKKIHEWKLSKDVRSVAFHPTKKIIAVGTFGKGSKAKNIKIYQYEPVKTEPIGIINAHTDDVTAVSFNHDGTLLASTADDGDVKIWDTNTWKSTIIFASKTKEGHKSYGHSVSFNSDSTLIASSAMDGSVKVWDLQQKQLIKTFIEGKEAESFGPNSRSATTLFHPIDPTLLIVSITIDIEQQKGTVTLYSVQNNNFSKVIDFPYNLAGAIFLAFGPNNKKLLARGPVGQIISWDVETGNNIGNIGILSKSFCPAIFDNTGKEIITGYDPKFDADLVFWKEMNISSGNDFLKKLVVKTT